MEKTDIVAIWTTLELLGISTVSMDCDVSSVEGEPQIQVYMKFNLEHLTPCPSLPTIKPC